nr:MAG TPA: hypothetical protein [Crassvirales sp.]
MCITLIYITITMVFTTHNIFSKLESPELLKIFFT